MVVEETEFAGLKILRNFVSRDNRGIFIKTFNSLQFQQVGLATDWRESYYSVSDQGVIRGMHFQLPPHDHEKLVYVTAGSILDVVVDLRSESATYGRSFSVTLAEHATSLYIPRGFAHGFLALTPQATVVYNVATGYEPTADAGIRWDSIGFEWPVASPTLSARDAAFQSLAEFESPF